MDGNESSAQRNRWRRVALQSATGVLVAAILFWLFGWPVSTAALAIIGVIVAVNAKRP